MLAPVPTDGDPRTPTGKAARALVERHRLLGAAADEVVAHVDGCRDEVVHLAFADREADVLAELAQIDVARLADLTDKNLRLGLLADAGYRTAADLRGATVRDLDAVPGVGRQTARGAIAAVDQLALAIAATKPVRLELDLVTRTAPPHTTRLLVLLHRLLGLGPRIEPRRADLEGYARSVAGAVPVARLAGSRLGFLLSPRAEKDAARRALARLEQWEPWLAQTDLPRLLGDLEAACQAPDADARTVWDDVEHRAADYYALLDQLVPSGTAQLAAHGHLTAELADRVEACPLDTSLLRANLRGYQGFGARFVLNQGRVLLGDEMGLGKTIQAIAAMADRAAAGARHFLVVCPASVLVSWSREVSARSALVPHRLHGDDREAAIARWLAEGGVGVTTFEGLEHVPRPGSADDADASNRSGLGLLVVDEAHYVKNPQAQRSQLVRAWAADTPRVLLMTGTPMENRLDEFLTLVEMLQPDVVGRVPRLLGATGADVFRHVVAPVYLRRNAEDVLVELPDVVEVDEWEPLGPAGETAYRAAVATGSFMAMRRAAFATPDPMDSTKLVRLLDIVDDAAENGRRVVVYSFFRDVLERVHEGLTYSPLAVPFGPITGDVTPVERQALVDAFSAATAGAVLLAQVQAGGVGLNIQAASVVVLCEPQLTPTAEAQAIARLHRMGQLQTVFVHRLLTEDAVDERIREILAAKQRVFDAFVRESSLAEGATSAVDVTEAQLARDVVAFEQARLGYGPVWDELEAEGLL